jgi:diguanylate cyclase (GGDEF)-like protein/PAS domain S-box-containing protein
MGSRHVTQAEGSNPFPVMDADAFRRIIDAIPHPIFVKNDQHRFAALNESMCAFMGRAFEDVLGRTDEAFVPKDQADLFRRKDRLVLDTGLPNENREVFALANGDLRTILTRKKRVVLPDGSKFIIGCISDITEEERTSQELRQAKDFFDTVIENIPVAVVVKNAADLRYVFVNKAAEEFYGLPRAEVLGKTTYEIYPKETADLIAADAERSIRFGLSQLDLEVPTPRNGTRMITARSLPILNAESQPQFRLTVIEDVTERKRAERRIAHLASHDPLTDLPNRGALTEELKGSLDQAAAAEASFAVLCLDLDHFKETNDIFGHAVGDELLCAVSDRFRTAADGAFLARVGGDEFIVISPTGPQPAVAAALSDRLIAAVAEPFEVQGHHLRVGVSIGVAIHPVDGRDAITLLGNADAALYRAKAEGRMAARFFEADMDKRVRERHALQRDLRSAIARNELVLYYQPQATMAGEVVGFEALARWEHPERGLVPPASFIALAEENGLIVQIGEWVLREACREAASWPVPFRIGVNLSPIQFRHGDLPALVHSILLETGLEPGRLELEITESVLVNDFARTLSILRRLKALGVKIAMDDFGTGYSSLSSLKSFPFDKIKIDRTFISGVEGNGQSAAIVRAVLGLGRGLQIPVTAEGVETETERAFLLEAACQEMQGYLIGRPGPIADFSALTHGRTARPGRTRARRAVPAAG